MQPKNDPDDLILLPNAVYNRQRRPGQVLNNSIERLFSYHLRSPIFWAGTPAHISFAEIEVVTTEPAPITAPLPITTPFKIITLQPSQTSSPNSIALTGPD